MGKEQQALSEEKQELSADQVGDVTGGLNWKEGAKVAGAALLGATAIGGAAIGGKKLYDSHKKEDGEIKEDDDAKTMKYLNGLAYAYGDTSKENPLNND